MATLPDRIVLALVRLYPRSWRTRYQREFRALVVDTPVGWHKVVDVARAIGPEWARAVRVALIDVDVWRAWFPFARRLVLTAVVAWVLAFVADSSLRLRDDYYSSAWSTSHVSPGIRQAIDAEAAKYAWMISPDRHEVALSKKYAYLSTGWDPAEAILIRPCCNLRWTLSQVLPGFGRLEDFAVLGWYALVGCAPLVLLFRLSTIGRANPHFGRVMFVLMFLEIIKVWRPYSLSFTLEGAVLASALFPLAERPSAAPSTALVSA